MLNVTMVRKGMTKVRKKSIIFMYRVRVTHETKVTHRRLCELGVDVVDAVFSMPDVQSEGE